MTQRDEVLGRGVFSVFPDNPDDPTATGVSNLRASLERVLQFRVPDTMAVQKYDIRRPESDGGGFEERYWSPVNSPVLGSDNRVDYIIHRVDDVTEFVRLKQRGIEQAQITQTLLTRGEQMEAQILLRAQEIQEANRQLREANENLTGLHAELERRVQERTAKLAQTNAALQAEIHERKLTENTLRASEERFRLLVEGVTDHAIIMLDPVGNVVTWNSGAEHVLGYQEEEIVGQDYSRFFLVEDVQAGKPTRELDEATRTGKCRDEGWRLRKGGSRFWATGGVTALYDSTGSVRGFAKVVRDITQRKLAEEHQARLVAVLESTSDFVGIADAQRRPIFINQAGRRMVGLGAEEDITKTHINDYLPAWSAKVNENEGIPSAIKNGTWMGETALLSRNGRQIPVSQVIVAHKTNAGEVGFLSTIMRDLTERKKLEEQFRQAQKMEAVGQLAGGVAHDFNNLLTIISGYSEILLSTLGESDPVRKSVTAISEAGERAAALTRQLLAFSRKTVLEPKVLDLNAAVRETEKLLRRLIGEDILLTTVLDPAIKQVKVDPGQLGQVLMNLAVNARDAMPKGGKLTVETCNVDLDEDYARFHSEVRPGQYVKLTVTDTGSGMSPEVKAHIFEPFFTTKGAGKGTGLGLAVVHGIVKQSGGHLEVYSEPGIGTTFKVFLPAAEGKVSAPKGLNAGDAGRGKEIVLLVEDEDGVRGLGLLGLQTNGYTALAAGDAKEALRLVEQQQGRIDLLVTDVVMPGISGPALAEALKLRIPHLKVLFCSGYTDDAVVRHGLVQEKVAFLQKPYSPLTLARKVRQVLDEK
jgi:two-component system cell cycle sensor histidine kinase/response regulator CckA